MRGAVFFIIAAVFATDALASPWVQWRNEAYARLAYASEDVEGLPADRFDAYAEDGLTDRWTGTVKAETLTFEGNEDFNAEGFRATLRRAFIRNKRFVLSLEGGVLTGAAFGGAPDGCDSLGAEARIGAGWSGGFDLEIEREWFAFAELAQRNHEGGCRRDRAEFGYGSRLVGDIYIVKNVCNGGKAGSVLIDPGVVLQPFLHDSSDKASQ